MSDTEKSVGSELVDRLRKFTDQLSASPNTDLSEIVTVRKVKLNLRPRSFSAEEMKSVRKDLRISQAVFAEFLGVSKAAVQDWEQGRNDVSGPVCRILEVIMADIESWAERIRERSESETLA